MSMDSYEGPQLEPISPRPYLETVTKEVAIEAAKAWFFDNFEDPVHSDMYISAEGGYQYIWGGPYDAHDILWDAFGEQLPEEMIDEIVRELEKDGTVHWTIASKRILPPDEDEFYQNPNDLPQQLIDKISILENEIESLKALKPNWIGHNNPPEMIFSEQQVFGIADQISVNLETLKSNQDSESKKAAVSKLREFLRNLENIFLNKKDDFIKGLCQGVGIAVGKEIYELFPNLIKALEDVVHIAQNWLT